MIAVCNKQQVTSEEFVLGNGGIRLRPETFGLMLTTWQTHWLETHQDAALNGLIQVVVASIWGFAEQLPTPPLDPTNEGDVGISVMD